MRNSFVGMGLLVAVAATSAEGQGRRPMGTYDVVIEGGRLIDGTGRPARAADIAVRDGWIVRVTPPGGLRNDQATIRLDAKNLVVSPGFIDVHSHTVDQVVEPSHRFNEAAIRQGLTTVVGGPDGGYDPTIMRAVIDSLGVHGAGTNVALYVGHNGIREAVLGRAKRAPTAEELAKMKAMVRDGMELGAVGFSSGLMYEPGMFSTTDEVVELAKAVAPFHGIYDSHVRDPGRHLLDSDRECIEIGERAGIGPKIAHEKAVGLENAGVIREVIRMVEAARARGVDAVTDQYPYDGAATAPLEALIVVPPSLRSKIDFDPERARSDPSRVATMMANLRSALKDPELRRALKGPSENGVDGGFAWLKATGYSSMRITTSRDKPQIVGKYLSLLAAERKMDPFDLVADLIADSKESIGITLGAVKEADVRALLVQPWNMIASDGGYVDEEEARSGHPRSTGTFPRVLGHYARDLKLLSLEEAVRKMTSLPADYVGLHDRGRVAEGQAADLAIWDPRTIADKSTWAEPGKFAVGMRDVLVSGVPVLRAGKMTGQAPGRYLRARR